MELNIEIQLIEPIQSNPGFESEVLRYMSQVAASQSFLEGGIWDRSFNISKSTQRSIDWRRGRIFDWLGGNNLGRSYPRVDYLKGGVVGSIKSTRLTDPKKIESLVRQAYTKMIIALKTDAKLASAIAAEVKIIVPSGTNNHVIQAIEKVGAEMQARYSSIKLNAPKIVRGIPGNIGGFLKGMGIAGGIYSAIQLKTDIENGDLASGIGSGAGVATAALEIGGGLLSSTALTTSAAIVGSFAVGYTFGTVINKYVIPDNIQDMIGGTLWEIDCQWEKIKEFYYSNPRSTQPL